MFGGYKSFFETLDNLDVSRHSKLSYLDNKDKILTIKKFNQDTGITTSTDLRLAIVKPAPEPVPALTKEQVIIYKNINATGLLWKPLQKLTGLLAVDIETNGTQAADVNTLIYGIGVSNGQFTYYFDFSSNSPAVNQFIIDWLVGYKDGLIGHNVMFDGCFLLRDSGVWLDWKYDTYALYRQLANEGHTGHGYGLKAAQLQLLHWEDKGDVELSQWLIMNGHHSDTKKTKAEDYYPGPAVNGEPRWYKARKSEMFRAPADILGYYCGLDAYSTLLLYTEVFKPSIEGQFWEQTFLEYHRVFLRNVQLLANQQLTGITLDHTQLSIYRDQLKITITDAYQKFVNHPDVRAFADLLNQRALDTHLSSEPTKFKKLPKLGQEPVQFTKSGQVSKNWDKYQARKKELETMEPELTQHWTNWSAKLEAIKTLEHFNANSPAQLKELFYDYLKFPVLVWTDNEDNPQPSTGVQALPGFGEPGKLLDFYREKEKELGYVQACLDHLIQDADGNYRLHPQFRTPGTLTCRLAGSGGVNLQQIPKTAGYLECWRPVPGKAWIDFDFAALEQVVMAELTRDPNLFKIYGPEARPGNDVYLFNGSQLPVIGPSIQAAGYHPDLFTPETVSATKKAAKKERAIAKQITLASVYGAGVDKLLLSLKLQGVDTTREEVEQIHAGYWVLYDQVKQFGYFLQTQLRRFNGYVLNGIGRPVCCAPESKKDISNRVVQSTGHDILMLWVDIYSRMLDAEGIRWDGIVIDFHDQSIIECDEKDADAVIRILGTASLKELNRQLDGIIPMKLDGGRVKNLAEAKCPDEYKQLLKERNGE